jgi:hypothetical protein
VLAAVADYYLYTMCISSRSVCRPTYSTVVIMRAVAAEHQERPHALSPPKRNAAELWGPFTRYLPGFSQTDTTLKPRIFLDPDATAMLPHYVCITQIKAGWLAWA